MRILIRKELENDVLYKNLWRKIYNKVDGIVAIQDILTEYREVFGVNHEDTDKFENLVQGAYDVEFGDYYYVITILPKRIKLSGNYIELARNYALGAVAVLYDTLIGIEEVRCEETSEYKRHDFNIIGRDEKPMDTFSIYAYENNEFYLEFHWKYI